MEDKRVIEILDGNELIAQIYDLNTSGGVFFPTPDTAEFQCGFGTVTETKNVVPHLHNEVERQVINTSEFILVLEGQLDVNFIAPDGHSLSSYSLKKLEGFLQFKGGHSIIIEAGTKYIELKQGPYLGHVHDKTILKDWSEKK
jgi:hypothetical protein